MALKLHRPNTAEGKEYILEQHFHEFRYVAPWGFVPVPLTSGGGSYNWGNYAEILGAGKEPLPFDIHWVIVSGASADADYEIELCYGADDTPCAQISFARTVAQDRSESIQCMTPIIPGGSRIRARCRDSVGSKSISIKIAYHHYDFYPT